MPIDTPERNDAPEPYAIAKEEWKTPKNRELIIGKLCELKDEPEDSEGGAIFKEIKKVLEEQLDVKNVEGLMIAYEEWNDPEKRALITNALAKYKYSTDPEEQIKFDVIMNILGVIGVDTESLTKSLDDKQITNKTNVGPIAAETEE